MSDFFSLHIVAILGNIVTTKSVIMDTLFVGLEIVQRLFWANWALHFKNS